MSPPDAVKKPYDCCSRRSASRRAN